MIRAHRVTATAQDDASPISGWNISPNIDYALAIIPSAASCGVILWDAAGVLVATGAALVGAEQPCILTPQSGQTVGMIDAELGWHLLLTTDGTESQRTIRIGPAVDLPDEIHPVYGDDEMALARATAAIDEAAHYRDDVTATCPLGLGAVLGDVVSVPVDGAAVVGQVEAITWTATPDGTTEQSVIRRHVAIAPEPYVEPTPITPPTVADDTGTTDAATATSGNVLTNDDAGLTVVAVNGLSASVGVAVAGSNGGTFTITSSGAWTFDPAGDFATLSGSETADTSVTYYASDGTGEAMGTLTVTVSRANAPIDPYWSSITLLIQPPDDTVSGLTSVNDRSQVDSTVLLYNGAHTDTTQEYPTIIFDGSNDYGLVPYSGGADITGQCTLDFIIVPTSAPATATVFSTRSLSTPINGWMLQILYGKPALYFWDNADLLELKSGLTLQLNVAHHIRILIDAAKNAQMAVNGNIVASKTATGWPAVSGYTPQIGISKVHNDRFFKGHIRTICVTQGILRNITDVLDFSGIAAP